MNRVSSTALGAEDEIGIVRLSFRTKMRDKNKIAITNTHSRTAGRHSLQGSETKIASLTMLTTAVSKIPFRYRNGIVRFQPCVLLLLRISSQATR